MRTTCLALLVLCLVPVGSVRAQDAQETAGPAAAGSFTDTPVCSEIINETGFAIYGSVETDKVDMPDGEIAYYKSNFRLKADEKTQICSNGPFFEGGRLRLTLRSLFPLFDCKTALGQPIILSATPKENGSGYDWSATCR